MKSEELRGPESYTKEEKVLEEDLKKLRVDASTDKDNILNFNDESLHLLVLHKPKTLEGLRKIKGFKNNGPRVEKFGRDIIDTIIRSGLDVQANVF